MAVQQVKNKFIYFSCCFDLKGRNISTLDAHMLFRAIRKMTMDSVEV